MPGEAAAGTWAGDAASSRATHGACSMLGASTPARAAGTCAEQSGLKAGNTPLLSPSHSVETPSLTSGMAVLLFSHPGSFLEPHLMCPDPRIGWTCPLSRSRGATRPTDTPLLPPSDRRVSSCEGLQAQPRWAWGSLPPTPRACRTPGRQADLSLWGCLGFGGPRAAARGLPHHPALGAGLLAPGSQGLCAHGSRTWMPGASCGRRHGACAGDSDEERTECAAWVSLYLG